MFFITLLLGSVYAIYSLDRKKIIAYSTIRQLGWIIIFYYRSTQGIVLCYIACHALYKSLLFLRLGILIIQNTSQLISNRLSRLLQSWGYSLVLSLLAFFGRPILFFFFY